MSNYWLHRVWWCSRIRWCFRLHKHGILQWAPAHCPPPREHLFDMHTFQYQAYSHHIGHSRGRVSQGLPIDQLYKKLIWKVNGSQSRGKTLLAKDESIYLKETQQRTPVKVPGHVASRWPQSSGFANLVGIDREVTFICVQLRGKTMGGMSYHPSGWVSKRNAIQRDKPTSKAHILPGPTWRPDPSLNSPRSVYKSPWAENPG